MKYYEYSIWDLGSRGFLGFFRDFRDLAEFSGISGIWDWDWDLIFKIWDLGLGFDFENLGSGIGIWDWFRKSGIWDWDLGFIYKKSGIWDPGIPDCRPLLGNQRVNRYTRNRKSSPHAILAIVASDYAIRGLQRRLQEFRFCSENLWAKKNITHRLIWEFRPKIEFKRL